MNDKIYAELNVERIRLDYIDDSARYFEAIIKELKKDNFIDLQYIEKKLKYVMSNARIIKRLIEQS